MADFNIAGFDPKTASRDEWFAFHRYNHTRHAEIRPDDPENPEDVEEKYMTFEDPQRFRRRLAIWDGSEIVGFFGVSGHREGAPGYDSNSHLLNLNGAVLAPYRRKGLGTSIFRKTSEMMDEYGRTVLSVGTEEKDGHAFLLRIGAEERFKGAENRLDLTKVDWEMVQRWASEGKERSPDSELVVYEDRLPDDVLEKYTPVITDVLNTVPFEELDHGDIVITPEMVKEWNRQMDAMGDSHHTYVTVEPDGDYSSMTDVFYSPHQSTYVWQGFTGVRPEYRGRGMGRWIKAAMLLYLRGRYEGLRWVVTDNAHSNRWMLAINEELGFSQYKAGSTYQISKESLDKYLANV